MSFHSNKSLMFQQLNLEKKPSVDLYMNFLDHDESEIERQMWESESDKKFNLDLASSTQYQQNHDLINLHIEKMTTGREQKEEQTCLSAEVGKKKSIKKSNKKENTGKKKDYKKNICGYITKTTVKESFSKEIRPTVEYICNVFGINYLDFSKTYQDYSFITGPTHLDNLITPRVKDSDRQQSRYEILLRIVFIVYYRWFAKNRYLRYMMVEGKMQRKGEYINYLNKIILPILSDEQEQLIRQFAELFGNQKVGGRSLPDCIEHVYGRLIEINTVEFEENEPEVSNHSQVKQINLNNPPEAFSRVVSMQYKDQDSFSLNLESFMF